MLFIGKLHEISFYGLVSAIISLVTKLVSFDNLIYAGTHVTDFPTFFMAYMFWASIAFLPIAIIGAFSTKYGDDGEGLSFNSDNLLVIFFAHIAEEILGAILSVFWLLKGIFTHELTFWKIVDFILYFIEIIFIIIGFISLS